MWPEDEFNDYSYMAVRKKYEEAAQADKKDRVNKAVIGMLGTMLKNWDNG